LFVVSTTDGVVYEIFRVAKGEGKGKDKPKGNNHGHSGQGKGGANDAALAALDRATTRRGTSLAAPRVNDRLLARLADRRAPAPRINVAAAARRAEVASAPRASARAKATAAAFAELDDATTANSEVNRAMAPRLSDRLLGRLARK
jgi:hypothetical protein